MYFQSVMSPPPCVVLRRRSRAPQSLPQGVAKEKTAEDVSQSAPEAASKTDPDKPCNGGNGGASERGK